MNSNLAIISLLRIHQWSKNLLLFVPLIMGHEIFNQSKFFKCFAAFIIFGMCASALYIVNDYRDIDNDRQHEKKKNRVLASGRVNLKIALSISGILLSTGIIGAIFLSQDFFCYITLYCLASLAYSLYLKRVVVIDIITLALFYTLRIMAGGAVVDVPVSQWLLSFSLFFFMSLACIKRYSELRILRGKSKEKVSGRGYQAQDLETVSLFGVSSGYIAVLVLVLYASSREVVALYSRHYYLWLVTPLALYWISRTWILAARGELDDDPLLFALTDRVSYITAGLVFILMILAM